jgi:DNA-binding transcriptional ArsR family regulator
VRPHRGSSLDDAWRPAPQSAGSADVFAALADPTRRTVLQEVALRGSATATELAEPLAVTRQAVAKHLGVLAQAGLVDARREGRETRYRPTPAPMGEAIGWMTEVGSAWDERLAALERTVGRRRVSRPRGPRSRA